MTDVKCETCRWWRRHKSLFHPPTEAPRYGNCHYHAPQPTFGTTLEDHFCRHHEAVAPVEPCEYVTRLDGVAFCVGDHVQWYDEHRGVRSGVIDQINDDVATVLYDDNVGTYSMLAPLEYLRHAPTPTDTTEG